MIAIMLMALMAAGGERENRDGVRAWKKGDVAAARKCFEAAAAKDTANLKYRYNRALTRSKSGDLAGAESDWALSGRDKGLAAKSLYNRGTARLDAAAKGKGDASAAASDLAQALRARPGWKEAARNLELARRLMRIQQQQQKQNQDHKNDKDKKKQDGKNPQPSGQNPSEKSPPQPGNPDPRESLSKDQADALLRAAQARDQDRLRRNIPKSQESHGKDW